jgi:hypothetical protein
MKKIITLIAITSAISSVAFASKACNYRDYFHLNNDSPVEIKLVSLSSDSNVIIEQRDAASFYIKDAPSCPPEGGYATVRYALDTTHYCDLNIKDGEFEADPEVTATCQKLSYRGLTYDGFMSYSYTLHFGIA